MGFDDLTEEQKAKARACKTPEDLVSLAKEEGVELTDDQLEEVAGGAWDTPACPDHITSV
ncbi:MAG: hypothetical protein IJ111_12540 [Eggerthellaceae bacterium]|nr:hypothetical protein [Eggerthellaceae bacterium]